MSTIKMYFVVVVAAILLMLFGSTLLHSSGGPTYVTFQVSDVLVIDSDGTSTWVPIGTMSWREYDVVLSTKGDVKCSMDGPRRSYTIPPTRCAELARVFEDLRKHITELEVWYKDRKGYADDSRGYNP